MGIHAFLSALQERHNAQKRDELSSCEEEYLMQKHNVMGVFTQHCPRMGRYLAGMMVGLSLFCSTHDALCQKPQCCREGTKAMQKLARPPCAAMQTQHVLRLSAQFCFTAYTFLPKQKGSLFRKSPFRRITFQQKCTMWSIHISESLYYYTAVF